MPKQETAGGNEPPSRPESSPNWPPDVVSQPQPATPERRAQAATLPGRGQPEQPPGPGEPNWFEDQRREAEARQTRSPGVDLGGQPADQPVDDETTPPAGVPAQPPEPAATRPDRVWVHLAWEAVLLVAVLLSGVAVIAVGSTGDLFSQNASRGLAQQMATLGLLATGLALSLRVAAPNLAVGAMAGSAGAGVAWLMNEHGWALGNAVGAVLTAAAVAGLALAVVVVGLHVPAWAASLGAAAALVAVPVVLFGSLRSEPVPDVGSAADQPWVWLGVFIAISVLGGVLWAIPGMRARFAGTRADRDPARRPGAAAGFGATLGLIGSSVLAAGAGVLLLVNLRGFVPGTTTEQTTLALAAVLLAGVSVFGRRGGIFGIVLAVGVLVLLQRALFIGDAAPWASSVLVGGAILVGLVISRLLELAGRRG